MSDLLPVEMVAIDEPRVRNMRPGSSGFVSNWALRVDQKQRVFVESKARVSHTGGLSFSIVRRDHKGFHVVTEQSARFSQRVFILYPFGLGLYRIQTITVLELVAYKEAKQVEEAKHG